jgi:hypothetical protein
MKETPKFGWSYRIQAYVSFIQHKSLKIGCSVEVVIVT